MADGSQLSRSPHVTHFAIEAAVATGAALASAPAKGRPVYCAADRVDEVFRTDGQRICPTLALAAASGP